MSLGIPIKESVFIETNIKDNCNYNICESCNGKMTATLIWEDGTVKTHPTFVGTRRFCDECKRKIKIEKYQTKRKNKNCKECGSSNPIGKQFCSDKCAHKNLLKRKKVKRESTKHLRKLYNGLTREDEIKYYKNLISKVSSFIELRKIDSMSNKRSYAWLVKYCKPQWILNVDGRKEKVQQEKNERDFKKIESIKNLNFVKRVVDAKFNSEKSLFVEIECKKGHIVNKKASEWLRLSNCNLCNYEKKLELKRIEKEKSLILKKEKAESEKIKNINQIIQRVNDFIDSGEYNNYKNWKESPVSKEHTRLKSIHFKQFLTDELRIKVDRITYFVYKSAGAICPYPIKANHNWCKHCETEKPIEDFRKSNICKECALKYRQETYYEQGRIQSRIQYKTNPIVKLHNLVRTYVGCALKGKAKKSMRTKEILGIEWYEFREYIENQFEPWMNWDNHGHGNGKWALQHIIPKNFAETEQDVYRLNYYKNFIPMDFSDNGALHDRILRYQLNEWHYNNCYDFLEKYKDMILESMDEIYK